MPAPAPPELLPLPARCRLGHEGRFELIAAARQLLDRGTPVPLGGRAFDLLLALAERRDRVASRAELIDLVWPGRVVEENNLSVQINALRKVLGSDGLVTVPGHGYRLAVELEAASAAARIEQAAEPAPQRPRTHLPGTLPLLIGRGADLAALGTLVEQHRLVTVIGAGGVGKTRLAQALLHLRSAHHAHGVCWVELGPVSSDSGLPGTVAHALGVQAAPDRTVAHLANSVSGLEMLLALDNAEHLLDGVAALVQALLDAAPRLHLLVTSQAPLRLAAERVLRLGPLAVPQGPLPATQAQTFGAVALFCERAMAAHHRFVLNERDVPAVVELCRQLDGVPLALELAAARAPTLGVQPLLDALSNRLQLLSSNRDRLAPQRQQNLRAALAWSHGLLVPREQRLFRRMAVLSGAASLALVRHVGAPLEADDGPHDPWDLVDALDQLVQRSLVEVAMPDSADTAAEPRYRLLESPRALALEMLAASGEGDAVRLALAHGVLAEFEALRDALLAGRLSVEARRRRASAELAHAREALAHLRQLDQHQLGRPTRGLPGLELALTTAVLSVALNDERVALVERCEGLLAALDAAHDAPSAATRVRAWRELSIALANRHPARSLQAARQALRLAREQDTPGSDRYPLYEALCGAAHMLTDETTDEAEALLREARAIEDPAWPAYRRRPGVRVQASIAATRGEAERALRLLRLLHEIERAAGEAGHVTLLNLANAELVAGDAAAAVRSGTQLVARLRHQRDDNVLAYARVNLAAAHLALDQAEAARAQLQEVCAAVSRVRLHPWTLDFLALLAALEGRHEDAARVAGAADARYEAINGARQTNEQRARERVGALLGARLDARQQTELGEQGRPLGDAEIVSLALRAPESNGSKR
jgi:predicted ATPase/DNA-binding winged helix-turn-helix (wHTH) protein